MNPVECASVGTTRDQRPKRGPNGSIPKRKFPLVDPATSADDKAKKMKKKTSKPNPSTSVGSKGTKKIKKTLPAGTLTTSSKLLFTFIFYLIMRYHSYKFKMFSTGDTPTNSRSAVVATPRTSLNNTIANQPSSAGKNSKIFFAISNISIYIFITFTFVYS